MWLDEREKNTGHAPPIRLATLQTYSPSTLSDPVAAAAAAAAEDGDAEIEGLEA